MNPNSIPEKPLYASMEGGKVEAPQEIYFFKREDGSVFHVDGRAAWALYQGRNKVLGKPNERLKIIGVGDGRTFAQYVMKAREEYRQDQNLAKAQQTLREGVDKELEACMGKVKIPPNYDSLDSGGNPVNINSLR